MLALQAAPLLVNTRLTTGTVKGVRLGGTGILMNGEGFARYGIPFHIGTLNSSQFSDVQLMRHAMLIKNLL